MAIITSNIFFTKPSKYSCLPSHSTRVRTRVPTTRLRTRLAPTQFLFSRLTVRSWPAKAKLHYARQASGVACAAWPLVLVLRDSDARSRLRLRHTEWSTGRADRVVAAGCFFLRVCPVRAVRVCCRTKTPFYFPPTSTLPPLSQSCPAPASPRRTLLHRQAFIKCFVIIAYCCCCLVGLGTLGCLCVVQRFAAGRGGGGRHRAPFLAGRASSCACVSFVAPGRATSACVSSHRMTTCLTALLSSPPLPASAYPQQEAQVHRRWRVLR